VALPKVMTIFGILGSDDFFGMNEIWPCGTSRFQEIFRVFW